MELTNEQIQQQAYEEVAAEKEGRAAKTLFADPAPDTASKTDEIETNPEETPKTDESEEGTETEESTPKTDDSEVPATQTEEEKVRAYAEKNRMTVEEAKEDIEKTEAILKQYKNDPVEMARAMRNKDREYHKLKAEQEKAKPKEPVFKRWSDDQVRDFAKNRFARPTPDMLDANGEIKEIAEYRAKFPGRSEIMSDAAILEDIVEDVVREYHGVAAQKEGELKQRAAKAREDVFAGIAEADSRFIPDAKAIVANIDDEFLLSDSFDINEVIWSVKGQRYDADIKAAEERGFKRAQQKPTIAGVKPASSSGVKPTAGSVLNAAQRARAEEMFDTDTAEDAHRMFRETFADELAKDKNFV